MPQQPEQTHSGDCHVHPDCDCPSTAQLSTERNRYFTGKYMTARDFREEQRYFLSHHHWHQWTLHGWGIVWGLNVSLDSKTHCLRIEPGMAIDCYGRELVLSHAVHFPVEDVKRPFGSDADAAQAAQAGKGPDHWDVLVGLRLKTIHRDPVPVLLDDECRSDKPTHNRIYEFAQISWQDHCRKCWDYPHSHLPAHLPQPVPDPHEGHCGDAWTLNDHNHPDNCRCTQHPLEMKSLCDCGDCGFVPLARVQYGPDGWTRPDDSGRRFVPSPFYSEALTHIVSLNWHHGGHTCLHDLIHSKPDQKHPEARLVVTFDRELMPVTCPMSLSQLIRLDYIELDANGNHDLDCDDPPIQLKPTCVQISEDGLHLYCDFPAHRVQRDLPVCMRFSLNCDLLLDRRGRAVDGDHIGGHVPFAKNSHDNLTGKLGRSGNGVEGGTFYTWTRIVKHHAD
jgi:hypothetical protein